MWKWVKFWNSKFSNKNYISYPVLFQHSESVIVTVHDIYKYPKMRLETDVINISDFFPALHDQN